jgi:hypothetical protein
MNLNTTATKQALVILEMQGYIQPAGTKEWMTTQQGEIVSGSKFPKYSHEIVEQSFASFADHLKRVNQDSSAEYKVADAVAFGDFLAGGAIRPKTAKSLLTKSLRLDPMWSYWIS